jgi:hypothetical protein
MLPDPLHPAIVHLPLALAFLSPVAALLGLVAISRGWLPARAWAAVMLLQATLAGSAWLALETGEDQEERVEDIVGDKPLALHEEAAKRFLAMAAAAAAVSAAGLLPGSNGRAGRAATVLGAGVLLAAAVSVGRSGGELVYKHGAAQAYTQGGAALAGSGGEASRADD